MGSYAFSLIFAEMPYLVSSANQIQIVFVQELGNNFWSERERNSSIVLSPSGDILKKQILVFILQKRASSQVFSRQTNLIWIRPQKITQQSLIRHICRSHNTTNLFHGLKIWRKTSVTAEDFLIDYGSNWETVEAICECLPQLDVVSPFA